MGDGGTVRQLRKYARFRDVLQSVEQEVDDVTGVPLPERVTLQSYVESAQLNTDIMYAANALFWCHLRLRCVDIGEHGITRELKLIKNKLKQIREAGLRGKGPKVNVQVAGRLIRHALSKKIAVQKPNRKQLRAGLRPRQPNRQPVVSKAAGRLRKARA